MPPVVRYLLVGLLNTACGFAVIAICQVWLGFHALTANALGYATGFFTSYLLNRSFTFSSPIHWSAGLPRFALVVALGYAVNLAVLLWLRQHFPSGSLVPQLCAIAAYFFVTYILSHRFVFRRKRQGEIRNEGK